MGKVAVVHNETGNRKEVDESALPYLEKLGYSRVAAGVQTAEAHAANVEERFSSGWEKVKTFGEGVASGVTLGLADPLLDDYSTRQRERVNPGTRMAGEIGGALLPVAPGLLGGATKFTPAGVLESVADDVVKAGVKAGKPIRGMAKAGMVEGAGQAAGQALGAALSGDPVTVESAVTTIGVGAFLGGGAGALAGKGLQYLGKLPKGATGAAAKAEAHALDVVDKVDAVGGRSAIDDFLARPEVDAYDKALPAVWDDVKASVDIDTVSYERRLEEVVAQIKADPDYIPYRSLTKDEFLSDPRVKKWQAENSPDPGATGAIRGGRKVAGKSDEVPEGDLIAIGNDGEAGRAARGPNGTLDVRRDTTKLSDIWEPETGLPPQHPLTKQYFKLHEQIDNLKQARRTLEETPDLSLNSLRRMSPEKFAETAHFLDKLSRHSPDAAKYLDSHITSALGRWTDSVGDISPLEVALRHSATRKTLESIAEVHDAANATGALWSVMKDLDSTPGVSARSFHDFADPDTGSMAEAINAANKGAPEALKAQEKEVAKTAGGRMGLLGGIAGRGAGRAGARLLGGGAVGGAIGWALGWGLVEGAVGGAAIGGGRLSRMASRAKERTFKALATAMGGRGRGAVAGNVAGNFLQPDLSKPQFIGDSGVDKKTAFKDRRDQILSNASEAGRNALAESLKGVLSVSPEMGNAMREDVIRRVEYLAKHAPLDPPFASMGGIGGKWLPDPAKVAEWSQRYAVAMDPPLALEAMAAGRLTPAMADSFRNTSPGLWSQVVLELSKQDLSALPKDVQMSVSFLLDKPLGLMNQPLIVAAFQAPSDESVEAAAEGISPNAAKLSIPEPMTAGQMLG